MYHHWAVILALHQLGTVVWIGGMFFAHMTLRPAAAELLTPPQRLPLLLRVFDRFFPWVWVSFLALWGSGFWMYFGLFGGTAGLYVEPMMGIAFVMTALFLFIWFVPYRRLTAAVAASDWPTAGGQLAIIRQLILTNLLLGLVTAILGAGGRYL
jgi:uncharacterized membrane protein